MDMKVAAPIALAAVAAIVLPLLLRGRHTPVDAAGVEPVEDEVMRYRAAVRADTLCARCGQANPPGSRYCHECGRTLPAMDAQEFEGTGA
jgi:hypothetical protein